MRKGMLGAESIEEVRDLGLWFFYWHVIGITRSNSRAATASNCGFKVRKQRGRGLGARRQIGIASLSPYGPLT